MPGLPARLATQGAPRGTTAAWLSIARNGRSGRRRKNSSGHSPEPARLAARCLRRGLVPLNFHDREARGMSSRKNTGKAVVTFLDNNLEISIWNHKLESQFGIHRFWKFGNDHLESPFGITIWNHNLEYTTFVRQKCISQRLTYFTHKEKACSAKTLKQKIKTFETCFGF